jgi:hypothetical protein
MCGKKGVGIMKETTQNCKKPLERHCQNKLALIVRENGSINPTKKLLKPSILDPSKKSK